MITNTLVCINIKIILPSYYSSTNFTQTCMSNFSDISVLSKLLKKSKVDSNTVFEKKAVPPKPIPATRSTTTNHKKSSHHHQNNPTFLKEIEGIEDDIKQLRSQVKMGSSTILAESDDTSTSMLSDDFEPGGIQFSRPGRHENHRFAPPVDMAVYPSGRKIVT